MLTVESQLLVIFMRNVNFVSWKWQLHPMVTLSTTEVEYVAATEDVKEGIWIAAMLKELKVNEDVVIVYSDS